MFINYHIHYDLMYLTDLSIKMSSVDTTPIQSEENEYP